MRSIKKKKKEKEKEKKKKKVPARDRFASRLFNRPLPHNAYILRERKRERKIKRERSSMAQ